MPAISHVFTISYVAEKLGEDEEWLWALQIDMFPEDGCLRVYGVGEDGVPAFTDYGIEGLKQIIADETAAGRTPPPDPIDEIGPLRCSPHADRAHSVSTETECALRATRPCSARGAPSSFIGTEVRPICFSPEG